jgi:hypothetical protein
MRFVEKYNYTIEQIKYQMHSHPDGSGPSLDDVYAAYEMKIPVYSVSPNGDVWITYDYYWKGEIVPHSLRMLLPGQYYGEIINW